MGYNAPGNILWTLPSEIVTGNAAITLPSGTLDSDENYQLPSLYDTDPAKPCKITGPLRLVFDWGSAQRIDGFALPNHNLLEGSSEVLVQLNSSNAWGAPAVSVALNIGAIRLDGHRAAPWLDLRDVADISGYRYGSIAISTVGNVKLGEVLWLARLREFSRWPMFGGSRGVRRRYVEALETEYGVVRVHRRRISQRTFAYPIKLSAADVDLLNMLADDTSGYARPFFIVRDSSVETDGGLYARITRDTAETLAVNEEWDESHPFTLSVMETSRSLPL